jgi:hypothetical protein
MGILPWGNRLAESGRIGDVGPRASRLALHHLSYSHFVLNVSCSALSLLKGEVKMKTGPRRNNPPVKVYCLPEERAQLQANAAAANLSASTYLLRVGLGYEVHGILDHRRVEELLKINADLGRLGGLLKLWLTNDERTAAFNESTIRALLGKIEDTQDKMHEVVREVVIPKSARR